MSPEKARWVLACAMAGYRQGQIALLRFGPEMEPALKKKVTESMDNMQAAIAATVARLTKETLA
jgi:hypothetical protein